jgi:HlyD family secretion protein
VSTTPLADSELEPLRVAIDPAEVAAKRRARARKQWVRRGVGLAIAFAAAAGVAILARPAPAAVELVEVRRGPMQVAIEEAGRTRVRDRYTLLAPLAGELARITLRPGDPIDRGTVLARIVPQAPGLLDPRSRAESTARLAGARSGSQQARAEVARLEAALSHAREDVETNKRLVASGSISREAAVHAELDAALRAQELASARFGAETAAHDAEVASAALARYTEPAKAAESFEIASPVAGRVLRVIQPSAGTVAPSAPLLEVGDPAELEVVVDVLTEDAVTVPPRAKVVLDRWGGPWPLAAHVRVVEPSGFRRLSALGVEEQRVSVIVDFDDPPERRASLADNYGVEAHIVTWESPDVLAAPSSAVFRHGDGWAAFVATDGRARLRALELGRRSNADVQILSGLSAGERVVVHPSETVVDGGRIAAR